MPNFFYLPSYKASLNKYHHTHEIYKYTVEIKPILNTLFHPLRRLVLVAYRWRNPHLFLFRPKRCFSLWAHPQFCGFHRGNSMICWFSFLFSKNYLDKLVKFRNVPFFIDNWVKIRLTLQTESFPENLELSLARFRSRNTVNLFVLGINNDEVPFLYRAQHYHLVDVTLNSSMIQFFAKMLSDLNGNVRKWNAQGQ